MAFVSLFHVEDLPLGEGRSLEIEDQVIAVFHTEGGFFAIDDTCSHAQASLAEGDLRGDTVTCPRHGGRFDVRTGRATGLPAHAPVRSYPVKIEDGIVYVDPEAQEV